MAEKEFNSKQPAYLYSAKSDLESNQDSQDLFSIKRESDVTSESRDIKRRVSWGNYRVRQYLQTTEESPLEGGRYPLIEDEDLLQAPLGSASPIEDPQLSQLFHESAKQDETYKRKQANSPSDMDISEIMSPPSKPILKPERTGRELIEEFNQSLESPPVYMNCEEDTPEESRYERPDPGMPALLIKCDNTPSQACSQDNAPRFPNLLTPVKEEDSESMQICSSGDTLVSPSIGRFKDISNRQSTPYINVKENSPVSVKSEASSKSVVKPILKRNEEEKKIEETPQIAEKVSLVSSKLDTSKLTPLKPIPWKANFPPNSSGRKTPKLDPFKERKIQDLKDRLEDAKKSLEHALYEKESLESLSNGLVYLLKEQDNKIERAISGLISENRQKEKSAEAVINSQIENLSRDILELKERDRWYLTYHHSYGDKEIKAFRHIPSLLNSPWYSKLYMVLIGQETGYEVSVKIMDGFDDEIFEKLWEKFSKFLNKYLSHNKEEFILENAAHYWHSFISLQEAFFKLKMAFEISEILTTDTSLIIKGTAGDQKWETGFSFISIDKDWDLFKSSLRNLGLEI
ncbi:unnamed protein product [Blepharisma stoltei]|uniref:Uncharacterized protein n=1 Tax=Blepharisma stoltei TaxID=1481888 RepID=A0AAU9J6Y1_9CILI|nr:unnamed protein product [Blepharisma stoltei]